MQHQNQSDPYSQTLSTPFSMCSCHLHLLKLANCYSSSTVLTREARPD